MSVIVIFIIAFVLLLIVGDKKDRNNQAIKQYITSSNYDILQHYLIVFTREKMHLDRSFWKTYYYILKVNFLI